THAPRDGASRKDGRHARVQLKDMRSTGKVLAIFAAPRWRGGGRSSTPEARGLVLDDGTAAFALEDLSRFGIKGGDTVTVAGKGGTYAKGKGMRIESVTLPSGETKVLATQRGAHRDRRHG